MSEWKRGREEITANSCNGKGVVFPASTTSSPGKDKLLAFHIGREMISSW